MAASTGGSPTSVAKKKPRPPARRPASMPRIRSDRTIYSSCRSVAGETEEVAGVVDPLVYRLPTDDRGDALLVADDVDQGQHHHAREDQPGKPFTNRNRGRKRDRTR